VSRRDEYRFFPACPESDLPPGSKRRVRVEGYDVCLYNVGGTVYASGDACPHERVSLGDGGTMDGELVVCGSHRWAFNVRTGDCMEDPVGHRLLRLPVGRREGVVYVGFPRRSGGGAA